NDVRRQGIQDRRERLVANPDRILCSRFTQFSAYTKRILSGLSGRLPPNFTSKVCRQSRGSSMALFNVPSCCRRITCCYEDQWRFDTAEEICTRQHLHYPKTTLMYRRKRIPAIGFWSNKVDHNRTEVLLSARALSHERTRSGTNRKIIRKTPP